LCACTVAGGQGGGADAAGSTSGAARTARRRAAAQRTHALRGALTPGPPPRQACIEVVPSNPANFNVDNVRVVKIPGGGAADARVVRGLVVKRGAEGAVQGAADAKVAVFAQGVDTSSTETKARARGSPGSGAPRVQTTWCTTRPGLGASHVQTTWCTTRGSHVPM